VYLDYIKREKLDFDQACAHIRETALMDVTFDNSMSDKRFNKATQDEAREKGEDSFTQVFKTMQNWSEETGNDMYHVYATINASASLRDSLMIPHKLWVKLAPDIKKSILETRKRLQESQNTSGSNYDSKNNVHKQYSNPVNANNITTKGEESEDEPTEHMAAHRRLKDYGLLYEDSSDEE